MTKLSHGHRMITGKTFTGLALRGIFLSTSSANFLCLINIKTFVLASLTKETLAEHHKTMEILLKKYPQVYSINFRSFISEAKIESSYDGIYSLSDINIIKALFVVVGVFTSTFISFHFFFFTKDISCHSAHHGPNC